MYKVLIVDDEPLILEGLKHIIDWEELDLEIAGVASYGSEAVHLIGNNNIHILITDIKMPFMNGLELIKHIRDHALNIKCIVLSGFDDFEYVKEAAKLGIENYLLKPVSESELTSTLINTIGKIESEAYKQIEHREGIRILRDNILVRWITNEIGKNELLQRAALLNIAMNGQKYFVAAFKVMNDSMIANPVKIGNRNLLQYGVQNIIDMTLSPNVPALIFPDRDGDIIAVFTDLTNQQDEFLIDNALPECMVNLKSYLNVNIFITIGGIETEYRQVYRSYAQAKDLQNYGLIMPAEQIVAYDEIVNKKTAAHKEYQIDYNALSHFILSKLREPALQLVDDFYDFLHSAAHLTPADIQNMTIEILFHIKNTLKSLKGDIGLFEDFNNLYVIVLKIKTIDELIHVLKSIINRSIDYMLQDDDKNNVLIKKVVSYIKANYHKEINLKTVASEFDNNAAYLGQLFKKEMGESFTSYLSRVKIEKAKELLLYSNLKVTEISEKIGYLSINYFYFIFKKITGVSPTEFKVNHSDN